MRDISGRRLRTIPVTSTPARSSTRVADRKGQRYGRQRRSCRTEYAGSQRRRRDSTCRGACGWAIAYLYGPPRGIALANDASVSSPQRRVPTRSIDEATTRRYRTVLYGSGVRETKREGNVSCAVHIRRTMWGLHQVRADTQEPRLAVAGTPRPRPWQPRTDGPLPEAWGHPEHRA
jgi:hypothetical protein